MPKDLKKRASIRRTVKLKTARRAIGNFPSVLRAVRAVALKTSGISTKKSSSQMPAGIPENHRPNERPDASKVMSDVLARATDVIGNKDKALRWMGSPIRALDFSTPISLLGTKKGAERVNRVLGQIEHGIW